MRPGLENAPCGSNAAFTPRVKRASGAGSGGITATAARMPSGARSSVQVPPPARAACSTAACATSVAGPAIHSSPPPQSMNQVAAKAASTARATAGPADGRTETRQIAPASPASGVASRTAAQAAWLAPSSRISAVPNSARSARSRSVR